MSIKKEQSEHFLSRWSKRKLEQDQHEHENEQQSDNSDIQLDELPQAVRESETEKTEEKPLWQRDDVDPDIRKQALNALFRQPEFNTLDGLNEYDDDFTSFTELGDVVTHEMKRMMKQAGQDAISSSEEIQQEVEPSKEDIFEQQVINDKEDNNLA